MTELIVVSKDLIERGRESNRELIPREKNIKKTIMTLYEKGLHPGTSSFSSLNIQFEMFTLQICAIISFFLSFFLSLFVCLIFWFVISQSFFCFLVF
jgi:hypothetical protein